MTSLQALYELQAAFSGSMVALKVPKEQWYKMRGSAVIPEDEPHVTIIYMPDLQESELPAVRTAIQNAIKDQEPFTIKVDEISTFDNDSDKRPHIALLERPALTKLRNKLLVELQKIRPDLVDTKFKTFKPHITIQWMPKDAPLPALNEEVSWMVDTVYLYFKSARRQPFAFPDPELPVLSDPINDLVLKDIDQRLLQESSNADELVQILTAAGVRKHWWNKQPCKYCDQAATKAILHSNGYAYIPVCNQHVKKCKSAIDEYCGQFRIPGEGQKCDFCDNAATFVTFQSRKSAMSCKNCLDKAKKQTQGKYGEPTSKKIK